MRQHEHGGTAREKDIRSGRSPGLSLDLIEVDNLDITTFLQALEVGFQVPTLDQHCRRASRQVYGMFLLTLGELLVDEEV